MTAEPAPQEKDLRLRYLYKLTIYLLSAVLPFLEFPRMIESVPC